MSLRRGPRLNLNDPKVHAELRELRELMAQCLDRMDALSLNELAPHRAWRPPGCSPSTKLPYTSLWYTKIRTLPASRRSGLLRTREAMVKGRAVAGPW